MHKPRRAMVGPGREHLSGTVELDETLVGGISRGMGGHIANKVPVLVVAESLGHNRIGSIRMQPTPPGKLAIIEFAQRVVAPGSLIKIDGAQQLHRLTDIGNR